MKIYWELYNKLTKNEMYNDENNPPIASGTIRARGYDEAAEDKLIPSHPEWNNSFELRLFSDKCIQGWWYNVGRWRLSNYV